MNNYQPALNQLRERRKGKPGELWLAIGVSCMAISPFVLAIVHNEGAEYELLKAQGVVSQAQITGHEQREEDYAGRKGRTRTKTLHFIEVRYDAAASATYADWKGGGAVATNKYPARLTNKFEVSEPYLQTHPVGSQKPVVFLRGNADSMELVEQVNYESSFSYFLKYYLEMAALFAAGLAMMVFGWRKRRAHV